MTIIDEMPIFHDFSTEDKDLLLSFSQERIYGAGEVIFNQGDISNAMYIVIYGEIEVNRSTNASGEKTLAKLGSGDILGEMSFFATQEKSPRSATAIAVRETRLFIVHEYSIKTILEKYPELYSKIQNLAKNRFLENLDIS